jgi:hypothetical protein
MPLKGRRQAQMRLFEAYLFCGEVVDRLELAGSGHVCGHVTNTLRQTLPWPTFTHKSIGIRDEVNGFY